MNKDGRKALLMLYKEYRPTSVFVGTELKSAMSKVSINGRKHPRENFKLIQQYGSHLNAIYTYSDSQIMGDIVAALGSDTGMISTMS